ncbi:divalent-cation tolerance protein CutA [Deltaproteobacteria bacterium TL4]
MAKKYSFLYITASSTQEAKTLGKDLVEKRLVACANIFPGVSSFYWWEGNVQEDQEVVFVVKTRKKRVKKVIKRVKVKHSYACPCVIELPIRSGNPAYLQWLKRETR